MSSQLIFISALQRKIINNDAHFTDEDGDREAEQLAQGHKLVKDRAKKSDTKGCTLFPGKKTGYGLKKGRYHRNTRIIEEEYPQSQKPESSISCSMLVLSLRSHGFSI